MTDTLPPTGYAADVPRPPVGFSIDVPDHWTVLDLNPETWDAWLDAFLDHRLAARPASAGDRVAARQALRDLMRQLHREQVFMAAILAADVGGELVSASATLAWRKLETHGEGIPVAGLRAVYARAPASPGETLADRRVDVVDLPSGPAVKVATRQMVPNPGGKAPGASTTAPVTLTQCFVPILTSDWLAVITTSTPNGPLAGGVEDVADEMAASLRFTSPS